MAAMAVVGAAAAQSSVSLYGRIDASIGATKTTVGGVTVAATPAVPAMVPVGGGAVTPAVPGGAGGDKGAQLRSGAHTASRWVLKGAEDLGAGLKANFQLEQGFNIDDGTPSGTRQFHRQAWVGLSGAFGALQLGRQTTTIDNMYAEHDTLPLSGYSAALYAFNAGAYTNLSRIDNVVYYKTPAMGGFSAGGLWAPGENKNGAPGTLKNLTGLQALYTNGPLSIGGAWELQAFNGIANTGAWDLGTSYDLGVARLFGQIEGANNKATNSKDSGYQIGIKLPMGAPTLLFSYARENLKTAGARVSTASAYSLMAQYTLSTRTYLYAAYLRGTIDPVVGATVRQQNYGLGLVHNF